MQTECALRRHRLLSELQLLLVEVAHTGSMQSNMRLRLARKREAGLLRQLSSIHKRLLLRVLLLRLLSVRRVAVMRCTVMAPVILLGLLWRVGATANLQLQQM